MSRRVLCNQWAIYITHAKEPGAKQMFFGMSLTNTSDRCAMDRMPWFMGRHSSGWGRLSQS